MRVRPGRAADSDGIVALIDAILAPYGDRVDLRGSDADLLDVETFYGHRGGAFAVLDDGGRVRGTLGLLPIAEPPGGCCLRRVYLDAPLRGQGWGHALMSWAFDASRQRGCTRVELWSDTRFHQAHRFFARHGFQRGEIREVTGGFVSYEEYRFVRELSL